MKNPFGGAWRILPRISKAEAVGLHCRKNGCLRHLARGYACQPISHCVASEFSSLTRVLHYFPDRAAFAVVMRKNYPRIRFCKDIIDILSFPSTGRAWKPMVVVGERRLETPFAQSLTLRHSRGPSISMDKISLLWVWRRVVGRRRESSKAVVISLFFHAYDERPKDGIL